MSEPPDPKQLALERLLDEARALAANERYIKSEANRMMMIHHIRLLEILATGAATTVAPPRHHV